MAKKTGVVSFRLPLFWGEAHAFCRACEWVSSGRGSRDDRNAVGRIKGRARRHTATTGHEVLVSVTQQWGCRIKEQE